MEHEQDCLVHFLLSTVKLLPCSSSARSPGFNGLVKQGENIFQRGHRFARKYLADEWKEMFTGILEICGHVEQGMDYTQSSDVKLTNAI